MLHIGGDPAVDAVDQRRTVLIQIVDELQALRDTCARGVRRMRRLQRVVPAFMAFDQFPRRTEDPVSVSTRIVGLTKCAQ